MNRPVIAKYLRISLSDRFSAEESNSISNQRQLLDHYISSAPEFALAEVLEFVDDGYSGANFDRPDITRLLKMAAQKRVNCIIIKDFSRLGRNYLEVSKYIELVFPIYGVRLIAVNEQFDSDHYKGQTAGIDVAYKNLIYSFFSISTSVSVAASKKQLAREGHHLGAASLFGYRKEGNTFVINPEAAAIVRRIFDEKIQGKQVSEIARELNEDKVPTPALFSGGKFFTVSEGLHWSREAVRRILKEEQYTGKLIYGKTRRLGPGKKRVKTPEEEWIVVPNSHEAIISEEVYNEARKTIRKHKEYAKRKDQDWLLRGLVHCGCCNYALAEQNQNSGYLKCNTYLNDKAVKCYRGGIKKAEIERYVVDEIRKKLQLNAVPRETQAIGPNAGPPVIRPEQRERRKVDLYIAYNRGEISLESYRLKKQELAAKLQGLKPSKEGTGRTPRDSGIQQITPELVRGLIQSVKIHHENRIEIVWNGDFSRER